MTRIAATTTDLPVPADVPPTLGDVVRELTAQVHDAEAQVYAAEAAMATVEAHVSGLGSRISSLRALAHRVGVLRPKLLTGQVPPAVATPVVDEATRSRARRLLARSGFVRVMP